MKRSLLVLLLSLILVFGFVPASHSQYNIIQLTNNGLPDSPPQINNNGYVAWNGRDGLDWENFLAFPCSLNDDYDGDGYISSSCGGNDCNEGDPGVNPGMSESEAAGNCSDWEDNDCDGDIDCHDLDCPPCPKGCSGSAATSTVGVGRVHGVSDLAKHQAYLLLPVGAAFGLMIRRRKR